MRKAPRPATRVPLTRTPAVLAGVSVWLLLVLAASAAGLLRRLVSPAPPGPQLVIFGLTAGVLLAAWLVPALRAWVLAVDWRALVAIHLARALAGGAFLSLVRRGELPDVFTAAGLGDIVVAVLAAGLMGVSPQGRRAPRLYAAWNTLGLADILLVIGSAVRVSRAEPSALAPLLGFPMALLPLFLVPLVLSTHILLYVRLLRRRRGAEPA